MFDKPVEEMTDREIAEETLTILREGVKAVESLSTNPMLRTFMPKVRL